MEYLGHKISTEGIKTLSDKVEGIAKAPVPEDKKQLQSFVGMVRIMTSFFQTSQQCWNHFTNYCEKM